MTLSHLFPKSLYCCRPQTRGFPRPTPACLLFFFSFITWAQGVQGTASLPSRLR